MLHSARLVAIGNLSGLSVNQHVQGFRKGGASLDMVIANQAKGTALREHGEIVIKRTVPESKGPEFSEQQSHARSPADGGPAQAHYANWFQRAGLPTGKNGHDSKPGT